MIMIMIMATCLQRTVSLAET